MDGGIHAKKAADGFDSGLLAGTTETPGRDGDRERKRSVQAIGLSFSPTLRRAALRKTYLERPVDFQNAAL